MLGQIERGFQPTISVLWRIVSGLGISFTTLIEEAETEVTVVSPDDVEPFTRQKARTGCTCCSPTTCTYQIRVLYGHYGSGPTTGPKRIMRRGGDIFFVHQGLELWREDESYTVPAGSSVHFSANRPHRYVNPGNETTKFYTIIFYAMPRPEDDLEKQYARDYVSQILKS